MSIKARNGHLPLASRSKAIRVQLGLEKLSHLYVIVVHSFAMVSFLQNPPGNMFEATVSSAAQMASLLF
jgi:hypothetical protein